MSTKNRNRVTMKRASHAGNAAIFLKNIYPQ